MVSLSRFLVFAQTVACVGIIMILYTLQAVQQDNADILYELQRLRTMQEDHFRFLSQKVSDPVIREVVIQQPAPVNRGGRGAPDRGDVEWFAPEIQRLPDAKPALPPLNGSLTYLPKLKGENVIAMSLWGSDPKYIFGAVRNAELVQTYFPGWKMRVYVEAPSEKSTFGEVPSKALDKLKELGVELNFIDPTDTTIPPMMWRFLVADDMSVDRFIIRDVDSRLSARDAAAVYMWVNTEKPFTCIRDHPSHAAHAVSGGMWGGVPSGLRDILRRQFRDIMYGFKLDYFEDMNFLIQVVWPRVKGRAYCLDSVSCDRWESSEPYPIPRNSYEHVGQVFDEHELARPEDMRILRDSGENRHCSPPLVSASGPL